MSDDASRLAVARADASQARSRLAATLSALQRRVEPRRLSNEAKRGLSDARDLAVREVRSAVFRRPGVIVAVAAGALLLAFRRPIAAMFRKPRKATRRR